MYEAIIFGPTSTLQKESEDFEHVEMALLWLRAKIDADPALFGHVHMYEARFGSRHIWVVSRMSDAMYFENLVTGTREVLSYS